MNASQFRERARASLRGNWGTAVLVSLVASLLCGGLSLNVDAEVIYNLFPNSSSTAISLIQMLATISGLYGIVVFVLSGPVSLGLHRYHLSLYDGKKAEFQDLFSQFSIFGKGLLLFILKSLYVALWSLPMVIVVIIGGVVFAIGVSQGSALSLIGTVLIIASIGLVSLVVIAGLRYSMAFYVMLEREELTPKQCLNVSGNLMCGNKARLFRLELSFLGWSLLGVLTLGIGLLFVAPYAQAAYAAFYRELVPATRQLPKEPGFELLPEADTPDKLF